VAKNALTPEQDILVRRFYVEVAEVAEGLLPDSPASARTLRGVLLQLLNYDQLPSGAFIEKGKDISIPYGSTDYSAYPCEWEKDFEKAINNLGSDQTSTSEPAPNTTLWEAVLPKDLS
jgi:hypothetical protein